MAFRYLSVCSGIESASVAWKPLGWECAGVSEIDKFPRAVLQHRLGAVPVEDDHRWQPGQNFTPLFGDFTKIEEHHVGPVDLLVGGTPCQSFSIAGKRLGLDDPRGNLTLEFLALAKRVRPTWLLYENVPGLLSHDEGRTFGTFLGLLAECGFDRAAWRILDAQYVRTRRFPRAVPQRRRRVFLVGYSGAADIHPNALLFDRESLRGNSAPRREAGQRASAPFECGPQGGSWADVSPTLDTRCKDGPIRNQLGAGVMEGIPAGTEWPASVAPTLNAHFGEKQGLEDQHIRGGAAYSSPAVANPLTARMHKGINTTADEGQTPIIQHGGGFDGADVAHALRGEGFDASEDGTGRGTPIVPVQQPFSIMPMNSGKDYKARETDVAQPIMAGGPVGGNQGGDIIALQDTRGMDKAQNGKGWSDDGTSYTVDALATQGVVQPHAIAIQERAVSENPDAGPDGKGWRDDGAAYTLEARSVTQAVAFAENSRAELRLCGGDGTVSAQLTTGGGKAGQGQPCAITSWGVRRLTPTECARLQGFPDDWARIPWRGKPAEDCPDGPQYKSYGNSMAVNVMAFIGERIEAVRVAGGEG